MDSLFTFLFIFMLIESLFVLLLVLPMPSNKVRGWLTSFVTGLWGQSAVKAVAICMLIFNTIYLWHVLDALESPLVSIGLMSGNPLESCEVRAEMYAKERNATVCGFNIFLFLILRRLVDIQMKLHEARADQKASHAVPMGVPLGTAHGKFD